MDKAERERCLETLLQFKGDIDSDDIKVKETIKRILLDNKLIIYALNNKELEDEEADPEDYFGVNILPYYMISPVQHNVQNFLCYEVRYDMAQSYQYSKSHNSLNPTVKTLSIIFTILFIDRLKFLYLTVYVILYVPAFDVSTFPEVLILLVKLPSFLSFAVALI